MKNRTHTKFVKKQKSHKSANMAYAKPVTQIYKMLLFTQLFSTSLLPIFFRFSHFAFFDVFSDQIGLFDFMSWKENKHLFTNWKSLNYYENQSVLHNLILSIYLFIEFRTSSRSSERPWKILYWWFLHYFECTYLQVILWLILCVFLQIPSFFLFFPQI